MTMNTAKFPLLGRAKIDYDSGHAIFGGVCSLLPNIHGRGVQIAPVRGTRTNNPAKIQIDHGSALCIRGLSPDEIAQLEGKFFQIRGDLVGIGKATLIEFEPAPSLVSQRVVFDFAKGDFMTQLAAAVPAGASFRIGRRSAITYRGFKGAGYVVSLDNLTPEQSLQVQGNGIGKFRSMGCGVFAPRCHWTT